MPYPYTLADLRNDVLSRLNEKTNSTAGALLPGDSDTPAITTAATIDQYLNEAQEDLARSCYPVLDNSGYISVDAGTPAFSLAGVTTNDGNVLWAARGVSWAGTPLTRCSRSTLEVWYPTWVTDSPGVPKFWFDQGEDGVGLYPVPAADGVASVSGLAVPPRLADDTATADWLQADLAKLLVFYAAAMIGTKNLQNAVLQERAPLWRQEYEAGKAALYTRLVHIDPILARAHFPPIAATEGGS